MTFESKKKRQLLESIEKRLEIAEQRKENICAMTPEQSMDLLDSSYNGLSEFIVNASRDYYGDNIVQTGEEETLLQRLSSAFINPFSLILIGLAVVSVFTDIVFAEDKSPFAALIIFLIVLFSGILRFTQESKSGDSARKLAEMVKTTTSVTRKGVGRNEIPMEDVVVGDIVHLAAGDMVPADARVLTANDLFINESSLTGESEPAEKVASPLPEGSKGVLKNMVYMGSTVVSGSATCLVVAVGNSTMIGSIAKQLGAAPEEETSFEKGVNAVSSLLLRFMIVMVPFVFITNGIISKNWFSAFLFAISIAVGLTPEMLPMLVSTCLSKGASAMADKKTVVKNLNAIQNLGSIDILCTDKTGTITQNRVVLEYNLNVTGDDDIRVLRHAFLNSYFQTGLRNLMDQSIIEYTEDMIEDEQTPELLGIHDRYRKIDEIPFDFERRRLSVVVEDENGKRQMVTKGAVEEMLEISSYAEINGEVVPLTDEVRSQVLETVKDLNDDGMRVVAVAQKTNPSPVGAFSVQDECDMVLIGYLAFLDPPKESAAQALKALRNYGVNTKILTGDNDLVTQAVCWQVGLDADNILLGPDIDAMSDEELAAAAETTDIFAKVTPSGKERIVRLLRKNGHAVGYMGDGINDAAAMKAADIGISVDNAVDIAKETADVILLEKNLLVLEDGIIEGRKVYANMLKYIKLAASSNFGNMFSVLAASIFLPFLPMASVQLLLLNLIYDISCTSIPWDNVDEEFILRPKEWDSKSVSKFMLWFGPISSVCDILTYALLYFVVCPNAIGGAYHSIADPTKIDNFVALFQSGWFVESMWTQSLVIHLIRTSKLSFIESNASSMVYFLTTLGIGVATALPFIPYVGPALGFYPLPAQYFLVLIGVTLLYAFFVSVVKRVYVKKYGELL
ncbi:MAG: magnesium-translocating P-type ATPase [Oscillospiraceae bacterium]|nr:magnesium-translocating P-type ATPase [Oscillospiraceae bacterium]